jgi:hypothetical protein
MSHNPGLTPTSWPSNVFGIAVPITSTTAARR